MKAHRDNKDDTTFVQAQSGNRTPPDTKLRSVALKHMIYQWRFPSWCQS